MFLLRPSKSKEKPRASTPLSSDFSDVESDASATSTVMLATTSDDLSDKSLLTYTIYSLTKAALKSTPHNHRPKELAAGFCIPTRFEKVTDENLKSDKISEVDRAKQSLKKAIPKKFENWRYQENKRSPDFEEKKAKRKKTAGGDPAVIERDLKRLREERSKIKKHQDVS
ncbi:hypothetical protein P5673_014325 [Acropora cervicornis]|uniref:Uncharacterized protein n=1 Tax=Acropora cervicornis TaxID=6130 RepID=A0AAD9QJW8_ACRCE|nr:hypothetical protein P5673_014325 [Acropora cervicornis]